MKSLEEAEMMEMMSRISEVHEYSLEARTVRAKAGSRGKAAICLPRGVISFLLSMASRSQRHL